MAIPSEQNCVHYCSVELNGIPSKLGRVFMFCENCGHRLEVGNKECPNCFTPIGKEQSTNVGENESEINKDSDNALDSLNGIKLSNEEFSVRTYCCSQLKFPSCTGYLSVTNRRVLFHGYGGDSRIVDEVPLDSVSGISTLYGSKVLYGRLFAGLIFCLSSFIAFANSETSSRYSDSSFSMPIVLFGVIALLVGVAILATCYRKTFVLKVYSSKANNSPIDIGSGAGGTLGSSALFSVVAYPTEQTDKMMLELGAMINDLQSMGDHGVERWKK